MLCMIHCPTLTKLTQKNDIVNELCTHSVPQLPELDTHRRSLHRAPLRHSRIVTCTRACALQALPAKADAKKGQQCCQQEQKNQTASSSHLRTAVLPSVSLTLASDAKTGQPCCWSDSNTQSPIAKLQQKESHLAERCMESLSSLT